MDEKFHEQYRKLGLNVSYYRKMRMLTQLQLAERIDIDRTHLGNIEYANSGVSLDVLFRISEALDVPVYRFFEFRDE